MKRLFLLRHGKAGFGASDRIRPLKRRGQQDAFWLGQNLKKQNILPDYILCSSATRATQTLAQFQTGSELTFPAVFQDDLYLASATYMLQEIRKLGPDVTAAMIIAHNPGLATLFQDLVHKIPKKKNLLKYSPGTVTILDFDITDWAAIIHRAGRLIAGIIPSERKGEP